MTQASAPPERLPHGNIKQGCNQLARAFIAFMFP
jgi:hypothetical protein